MRPLLSLLLLLLCSLPAHAVDEALSFDDAPLREDLLHPAWFKMSFLHLGEDLQDVREAGKRGLVVYFGQKRCPYCEALMKVDFGKRDIVEYTRRHFEVVALDIHGERLVTTLAGEELSERELAEREGTNFTPSLVFYDLDGHEALRLRGYYPPYRFRAALEFVADGHYKQESFREYLERADPPLSFEEGGMNLEDFFSPPPHDLSRHRLRGERPLAVFFEQGDCHACDVLHSEPLREPEVLKRIEAMDAVQLDMWADTPVVTPTGERTTARAWADRLGLFYAPTLIFFDQDGREIIRVDSVVRFYRLKRVLDYVASGAHRQGIPYPHWRP